MKKAVRRRLVIPLLQPRWKFKIGIRVVNRGKDSGCGTGSSIGGFFKRKK